MTKDYTTIINQLSSSTKFYEYRERNGDKIEYHEVPSSGELVAIRSWYVSSGDGDVMPEFEVEHIASKDFCAVSKAMARLQDSIESL